MKLISFAVPCYNSQEYMRNCIESLLIGGDLVEIIIINDGSKDSTSSIAHEYAEKYSNVIVVDKENGGHGSGVNKGLEIAQGLYYKVVDSDDWIDKDEFLKFLEVIKEDYKNNKLPDMYIGNYVYEKVSINERHVCRYDKCLPKDKLFGWNSVKKFPTSLVMMMHSIWYKLDVLKECELKLPEHTFYVDNIYVYKPLPFIKTMKYVDLDLYRYFIGREDQSVNVNNIVKRYDQQINVMNIVLDNYSYEEICSFNKGLKKYCLHYINVIMMLTLMFTACGDDNKEKRKEDLKGFWKNMKEKDKKMYKYLYYRGYPSVVNFLPFKLKKKALFDGYRFFRRKLKCS